MRWCQTHDDSCVAANGRRKFMSCTIEFDHIVDAVLWVGKREFEFWDGYESLLKVLILVE